MLRRSRPRDAVLGEEFGRTGGGPRCWVIDPIDGTKNYVRGVPVWATLIGLMDGDEVVIGVVSAPAARPAVVGGARHRGVDRARPDQGEPLPGVRRGPARGRLVLLLRPGRLGGARHAGRFPRPGPGSVWRTRAYGDFWSHVLVAEGAVDFSAEPEVTLWDLAALQIIVEEAGGTFTDLDGQATPDGRQRGVHQRPAARGGAAHADRPSPQTADQPRTPALPRATQIRPSTWAYRTSNDRRTDTE